MELGALFLLVIVVAALAVGLHAGPHTSLISGVGGFVVAGVFLIFLLLGTTGSISVAAGALTAVALLVTMATAVVGIKSLRTARGVSGASPSASLWSQTGVTLSDLSPSGTVQIGGETWSAEANSESIPAGTEVFVVGVEGLHLKVEADPLGAHKKLEGG